MKSVAICLIILILFGGGFTATFKDSPMDTNHLADTHKCCKVGCVISLCSKLTTKENSSEIISSTPTVTILILYIAGSN